MKTKKQTIIFISILFLIVFVSFFVYKKLTSMQNSSSILQAEISYPDSSKKQYIEILSNGKVKSIHSFTQSDSDAISVDPWIFEEYVNKNKEIYLTLKKYTLKDNKNNKVHDENYYKLVDKIAKDSKHSIGILNLFKVRNKYYAFVKDNAGLSDEGNLYKFNSRTNKLIKICTIDSGEIIKLKHTA
ncbi:hypothetical protein [Lactobacillus sp. LL6]|uniref:hypothetical protein n=1 Tax=Lactobacillus sp. LL6 TaxID=2596827 RepID=UPI0011862775|nr:hypothetical protein [Lactobacillus sp. LL6]TSO26837.1 hypothetical protein FOD82_07380 [Lactobacillus sp. LL6]